MTTANSGVLVAFRRRRSVRVDTTARLYRTTSRFNGWGGSSLRSHPLATNGKPGLREADTGKARDLAAVIGY